MYQNSRDCGTLPISMYTDPHIAKVYKSLPGTDQQGFGCHKSVPELELTHWQLLLHADLYSLMSLSSGTFPRPPSFRDGFPESGS